MTEDKITEIQSGFHTKGYIFRKKGVDKALLISATGNVI